MNSPYISSINKLSNEEKSELIIENHLYISGWSLYDVAQEIMFGCVTDDNCFIYFAGLHEIYGVVVVVDNTVNIFVRPEYRRNKIGTYLMKEAETFLSKSEMIYGCGVDGSEQFWESIFDMVI